MKLYRSIIRKINKNYETNYKLHVNLQEYPSYIF